MKKEDLRTELIENAMKILNNLSTFYCQGSPAWTLIRNSWGHINSVYYLETRSGIDHETLGVKSESDA